MDGPDPHVTGSIGRRLSSCRCRAGFVITKPALFHCIYLLCCLRLGAAGYLPAGSPGGRASPSALSPGFIICQRPTAKARGLVPGPPRSPFHGRSTRDHRPSDRAARAAPLARGPALKGEPSSDFTQSPRRVALQPRVETRRAGPALHRRTGAWDGVPATVSAPRGFVPLHE